MTSDCIDYGRIPPNGMLLAYLDDRVVFLPYELDNKTIKMTCDYNDIISKSHECHFFDKHSEYRIIYRQSRNDYVDKLFTSKQEEMMDSDLLYTEDVLVKSEYIINGDIPDRIRITSRYIYSDNDTLILDNYRIGLL